MDDDGCFLCTARIRPRSRSRIVGMSAPNMDETMDDEVGFLRRALDTKGEVSGVRSCLAPLPHIRLS